MKKLSEKFGDTSKQLVWLDSWAYCKKLFLDGQSVPWGDSAGFDGFVRKADSLLNPGVTCLPLSDFLKWVLEAMPNLKFKMAEKSRTGYALKTLLRNEEVRKALVQAINIAGNALPNKPLVLEVPSPRDLVVWAYQSAHGKDPEVMGIDQADSAGVYLSDFVTSLGKTDLSGIVVNERSWEAADWKEESTIYTPLRNVTGHQLWNLGIKIPFKPEDDATLASFDFAICPLQVSGDSLVSGTWIDEEFWSNDSSEITDQFSFSVIPASSVPEKVLENRKLLGGF